MEFTAAIIESPYGGTEIERNVAYAKRAMRWAFDNGYAPFASHLLYTQILDDSKPSERTLGIEAGLHIGSYFDETLVFDDYGVTEGMALGIDCGERLGRDITYISIGKNE